VIDLGTNTVLMVVGRRRADGSVEVLDDVHGIARLGQGVDAQRRIGPAATDRVCSLLATYRDRALERGATHVRVYGTSALRDAANAADFAAAVQARTGLAVQVVTGPDEASLTFAGAAFGLQVPSRYAVLDIGGGSTELALGRLGEAVETGLSVDLGAVRLTERCFPALPPAASQVQAAVQLADRLLAILPPLPPTVPLVGVAGTVTTLGALDLGLTRFDAEELNGHRLTAARAVGWRDRLLRMGLDEARGLAPVAADRADIIAAGALILCCALARLGATEVIVSTRGIRYGLLLAVLADGDPPSHRAPD
jgi:exopolyphosphatase/guanosine-5'-triphosphate,3'-diphosphate pyrophosphatase